MERVNCNLCKGDNPVFLFTAKDTNQIYKGNFNLVRCKNCGLVYINPRPSKKDILQYYSHQYYGFEDTDIGAYLRRRKAGEYIQKFVKSGKILDIGEIFNAYNTKALQELSFGAIIRCGLKRTDGIIEIEFGKNKLYSQLDTIEYFFTFKKDRTIKYLNHEINFKINERILTYYSYKYDEKNITFLLTNNGFKIVRYFFTPGHKYLLALVKLK